MAGEPIAIVTGGESGIGAACVAALAKAGGRVVFTYFRDAAAAGSVAQAAGGEGRAHAVQCDVSSEAAVETLFAEAEPDTSAQDLIARLHAQREKAWPNARMIAFADEMLGRQGSLSEAVRRLHALQLRKRPHLDQVMRDLGRGAEVDAALRD